VEKQEEIILKQSKEIARLEEMVNSNNRSPKGAGPSSHEFKTDCSDLVKSLDTKLTEKINSAINHLNGGKLLIQNGFSGILNFLVNERVDNVEKEMKNKLTLKIENIHDSLLTGFY